MKIISLVLMLFAVPAFAVDRAIPVEERRTYNPEFKKVWTYKDPGVTPYGRPPGAKSNDEVYVGWDTSKAESPEIRFIEKPSFERWEIHAVKFGAEDQYLKEGWEPFAVTCPTTLISLDATVWFRRRR